MAKLTRRRRRRRPPRRHPDQGEPNARVVAARQTVEEVLKASRSPAERQADKAADHATSAATGPAHISATPAAPQRKADAAASTPKPAPALGPGVPLPAAQKARFAGPLGDSLDGVRVDTSASAARATGAMGARAVTVGRTVGFAPGAFAPDTGPGAHLLAHELAHTVQQKRGRATRPQAKTEEAAKHGHPGPEGGLLGDSTRARMNIFVRKGDTLMSIASRLLPIWLSAEAGMTEAQRAALPADIRTTEGLARALMVHHRSYLMPPGLAPWQDGLRLPLPALRDPGDGKLVVNLPLAGKWLGGWDSAWAPALTKPAGETVAAEGEGEVDLARALLTNPKSALPMAEAQLGAADAGAATRGVEIMNMLVNHQVETLSAVPEGKRIFELIAAALMAAPEAAEAKATARARRMLSAVRAIDEAEVAKTVRAYVAARTGNCMEACYIGIEALLGEDRRKAVEGAVAQKDAANPQVDLDQVITMMEMMQEQGAAGSPHIMTQDFDARIWDTSPDTVIDQIVAKNSGTPGYYFFGLSVVTGYHTMMGLLDLRDPAAPKFYVLDQTRKWDNKDLYGQFGTFLTGFGEVARADDPDYNKFVSKLWPIYPKPGTVMALE